MKEFYNFLPEEAKELFKQKQGDAETLAGFILEQTNAFPNENDTISIGNIYITVLSVEKNLIQELEVHFS